MAWRNTSNPMSSQRGYWTPGEIQRLLDSCICRRSERLNWRDKLLIDFTYRSCRRVSEVVRSFIPDDIQWKAGEEPFVEFEILKKRDRVRSLIPMPSSLMSEVEKYIEYRGIDRFDYVFPISRQRADQIIKEIAVEAGVEDIGYGLQRIYNQPHMHILRHSFLVNTAKIIKDVKDIVYLKRMAQHSDINQTMYYLESFAAGELRQLQEEI